MSKKLSFDLDLNAQGFKHGINEAKGATAEYTNATRDLNKETEEYLKSFGSLRKQFAAAKKEAQNLAAQFAALGEAEKNSEYGQELAESLDIAIRKAAELQDVMGDTNQAIKNAASDTQGWDAMKDSFEIGKDLATAYAGAVAKLTGNEKALKDLVANVAMVQGAANAAIKIGNALQKQSNVMIALGNVQLKAKAIAEELATKKTIAATAAQRVFNAVAKANPYVLLATVAIAAATAIGGYMLATRKASEEQKKVLEDAKKLNERWKDNERKISESAGKIVGKYMLLKTEYQNLSSEHQKVEWIKTNKEKFDDLGISVNNVKEAEEVFVNRTREVVEALEARVQAAAMYEVLVQEIAEYIKNGGDINDLFKEEKTESDALVDALKRQKQGYVDLSKEKKEYADIDVSRPDAIQPVPIKQPEPIKIETDVDKINKGMKTFIDLQSTAAEKTKRISDLLKGNANTKSGASKELTVYQALQNEVSKYKKQLENIKDPYSEDGQKLVAKIKSDLEEAEQNLKDYEIAVGIKIDKPKSTLEQLKDELKDAEAQLPFAVSDEDIKKAQERIKAAKEAVEKEEIRLGIKVDPEIKNSEEFRKIMEKLYEPPTPKYDFSGLSDAMQEAAEKSLNDINRLEAAIKSYRELLKATKEPTLIEQIMEQLRKLGVDLDVATLKVKLLNDQSKSNTSFAKEIRDRGDAFGYYGQMLNGAANGLSALGDSEEVQAAQWAINSAAMIAQCVQNIAAMQAEAIASGTASGARLPFPANLAAIATIVATIGSIFASLPTFEEGGVIPGSSLHGDKVLIRANSRERVLTEEQNKNFEKIANSVSGGAYNTQTIIVEGKIKGKDLLLVQKNYNTTATKAGQSIKF